MVERPAPLQPGEPAPDFTLPTLHRDGVVSMADYRGENPVLVAMFRGLYCAFCRRHVAQLADTSEKLKAVGVDALAVVATPVDRARLYLRFHPTRVPLAADPEMVSHRAFGLPLVPGSPESVQHIKFLTRELLAEMKTTVPETATMENMAATLGELDGFPEAADGWDGDRARHDAVLVGQFLVDREGIVRWANVEGARDGIAGIGNFPSDEEFVAAAKAL